MWRLLLNSPLVFIDTETTGIHPERLPWEIAMIRRDPDSTESTTVIQISPVDLSKADPFGLKVGKFYKRHYDYCPIFDLGTDTIVWDEESASESVESITRGAHLVGAVPSFDAETLDKMLRRYGRIPA